MYDAYAPTAVLVNIAAAIKNYRNIMLLLLLRCSCCYILFDVSYDGCTVCDVYCTVCCLFVVRLFTMSYVQFHVRTYGYRRRYSCVRSTCYGSTMYGYDVQVTVFVCRCDGRCVRCCTMSMTESMTVTVTVVTGGKAGDVMLWRCRCCGTVVSVR